MISPESLEQRLRVFTDASLVERIPSRWQRFQGMVEMALYVVLPDARDAKRYAGAPLGHPIVRQPLSLWMVGSSHLRVGNGLGAPLEGLFRHLMFVFHDEMPFYDLQLIQTHPDGLERVREWIREVEEETTEQGRRIRRASARIVPNGSEYRRRFLAPGGYLDRAAALDYDCPLPGDTRPEFMTLVNLLNYCARAYPASPAEQASWRLPFHLLRLFTTRLRREAGAV